MITETSLASASMTSSQEKAKRRNSLWWDAYRRLRADRVAVISFAVIIIYCILALSAKLGLIFPNYAMPNQGASYGEASWLHPFGFDLFGRDILARAVHGIATAMSVGVVSSAISLVIGITLGALAGYFGGKTDALITWLYTTVDSVPYILLIPSLSFVMGRGLTTVFIAVGLTSWVTLCRLVRAEFMKHKEKEYVVAAYALGASHTRRIFTHIFPNVTHIAFVQFGLGFVSAIKFEVILSYIGLGVEPSVPSWGIMLEDAALELSRPFFWKLNCWDGIYVWLNSFI